MSATDHTLTDAEREDIEELLRLHVLADDEQIVYDLFETLLTQRGVTYEARLATAEAEKEALRERVGRLEAQLAEVRRTSRVLPCDGLCSEYPEEDCSLHGREPAELWEAIAEKNKRAEAAEAALTGLVAEVESLAEASLQDGRGGAWVHDVWFRALLAKAVVGDA